MKRHVLPWRTTSPREEQIRFIGEWKEGRLNFTWLCRKYGISRKTGYKRVHRFREHGWRGLEDPSRAPRHHPNQTAESTVELLLDARRTNPAWGPKKLLPWLQKRNPDLQHWPAPSTVAQMLKRAGLAKSRRPNRRSAPWRTTVSSDHPNDVWTVDFKGWFRTQDGQRCDPLTLLDSASRYLLVCSNLPKPTGPYVKDSLEDAFRQFGLPLALRSDNGTPFASNTLGGLSKLTVWCIKLGVLPQRIRPGHPEENGSHERFHRTLKAETAHPPQSTWDKQQQVFAAFKDHYNQERPHEALGQRTPSSQYHRSDRSFPSTIPEIDYNPSYEVR